MKKNKMPVLFYIIITIVTLVFVVLPVFGYLYIPHHLPIEEVHRINAPFINLIEFDNTIELEYVLEKPRSLASFSSGATHQKLPWTETVIRQSCVPKGLEPEREFEGFFHYTPEKVVWLKTNYYRAVFPLTVNMVIERNSFGWSLLSVLDLDEYAYEDDRFDKCFVAQWSESHFYIFVVRGKKMMYLTHTIGNRTMEDYLNELDRIL